MKKKLLILIAFLLILLKATFSVNDPICNSNEKSFLSGQDLSGQEVANVCGSINTPRIMEVKLTDAYYYATAETLDGLQPGPENGFLVEFYYGSAEGTPDTYIPNPLSNYGNGRDSSNTNADYIGNGVWMLPAPTIESAVGKFWVYITLTCLANTECSKHGISGSHKYQTLYVKKLESCDDTDSGINYYLKGYIMKTSLNDFCMGNKLNEMYCDNEGNPKVQEYLCPYGCEAGKCVQNPTICADSDNGADYAAKGTVSDNQGHAASDYCSFKSDSYNLVEFKCGSKGEFLTEYYLCTKGCINGACITSSGLTLKDFPHIFVKDGNLNAIIVVGDNASSSNVIEQSKIILFFGDYLGRQIKGAAKLSSEVTNLNQNIISIGNPCSNPTSALIIGNPQPCDKYFEKGKASIKLYNYGEYVHLVVAGYTDKGTKDAVDVLIDYNKYNLNSLEFVINIRESLAAKEVKADEKEPKKKGLTVEEKKKDLEEPITKENKTTINIIKITDADQKNESAYQEIKPIEPKKENIINKFVKFILSIFKR